MDKSARRGRSALAWSDTRRTKLEPTTRLMIAKSVFVSWEECPIAKRSCVASARLAYEL